LPINSQSFTLLTIIRKQGFIWFSDKARIIAAYLSSTIGFDQSVFLNLR